MAWPYHYQTGVTHYDREKAFAGYNLFTYLPNGNADKAYVKSGTVDLLDMDGLKVHSWHTPYPVWYPRLQPDGNLVVMLRCTRAVEGRPSYGEYPMGGATGMLMELDWDGNILFEYFDPAMHHDFRKLDNGNYIYVGWEKVPADLAKRVRGGQKGTEHKDGTMFCDYFHEINSSSQTVWKWRGIEHFDPDIDIIGAVHSRKEWSHINAVDVMDDGNILSDSRYTDGAFIIERGSGVIIWRWGNVAYLDAETDRIEHRNVADSKTMGGPHDAHVIAAGLPGQGNMLIYDNGMYNYYSRALEVDIDSDEVVWQSNIDSGAAEYIKGRVHFSPYISGAERMPNGNTLICCGASGVIFELTPQKEIVWQFVRAEPDYEGNQHWGIYRAYRYGRDYCPQFAKLPPP
ncbi:MAG: aryl-sulfate sulfotransferase [Deltaproteobacteria bacterium]|nr:aryl-sulfate sulfotransferase [Deltaproteobacteria bacterium]